MTSEELSRIIENGQEFLNINLSAVSEGIVEYSLGMPSTCHQLALYTCIEKDVMNTRKVRLAFTWRDLDPATKRWVDDSSDTIKAKLFRALGRRVIGKYDNCRIILKAVASGPLTGMTFDEILAKIQSDVRDYPERNLRRYLRELTKDERGQLLKTVSGGKWRFAEAFYQSIVYAMLAKPQADYQSPSQYVAQAVANSWTDTVFSGGTTFASTEFTDATGTYHLDWQSYLDPALYGTSAFTTDSNIVAGVPTAKRPALYEAPSRRTRKSG